MVAAAAMKGRCAPPGVRHLKRHGLDQPVGRSLDQEAVGTPPLSASISWDAASTSFGCRDAASISQLRRPSRRWMLPLHRGWIKGRRAWGGGRTRSWRGWPPWRR
jgi:hypothetical protein